MLRAKDARAHATWILHADRRRLRGVGSERRDDAERVVRRIVHEDRRAACTDRFRYFRENRPRCFFQRNGATKDFANSVEQIDLFVPLRELVRGMLDLERGLEILRHDREHEAHVALEVGRCGTARAQHEPRTARSGHGCHEHATGRGIQRSNAVLRRRQIVGNRHHRRSKRDGITCFAWTRRTGMGSASSEYQIGSPRFH